MNVDELQSVRNRERQTDSLQQLSDSFYRDAGEFIRDLKRERSRVAGEADDPFDSPEVRRLTDEIKTAESTVESIYERRVGKIVKQASLEAAGMPAAADGLTTEELELFERLVSAIEQNREHVLEGLLADGSDAAAATGAAEPASDSEPEPQPDATGPAADTGPAPSEPDSTPGVSAADAMGAGAETDGGDRSTVPPDNGPAGAAPGADAGPSERPEPEADPEPSASYPAPGDGQTGDVDRATVRITDDVGEIYGVDDRSYELSREDVVTLPTVNAGPLVEQGAAERLD